MDHSRVFALLIGIDNYASGSIWNLNSCADDALKIRRWLRHDLDVPENHICVLLNRKATKQGIEDAFMKHLVNNDMIEPNDAIIVYFAGHGSSLRAPVDWFDTGRGTVDILCSHDHDTKIHHGKADSRVVGISDRSLQALLDDLAKVKGDNVTLILDCCFSPTTSPDLRASTRWTPTRASSENLYAGLWSSAKGAQKPYANHPLLKIPSSTHVLIAACGPDGRSAEGVMGGRFTNAFLALCREVSLHRTTYRDVVDRLLPAENAVCVGKHRDRLFFNALPFVADVRYVPVENSHDKRDVIRVGLGAIHGATIGSELSVHIHNYRHSSNPSIANLRIEQVYPTYSLAKSRSAKHKIPPGCWAKITHWNNHIPFSIYVKKRLGTLYSAWKLGHEIKSTKSRINISCTRHQAHADIIVGLNGREVKIENKLTREQSYSRVVHLNDGEQVLEAVDQSALFHQRLNQTNPERPLRNVIEVELFQIDPTTWKKMGGNILQPDGTADISYEQNAVFSFVMRNYSDTLDLWPQLVYMHPQCCGITTIYHPAPTSTTQSPPLKKRGGFIEIGTGGLGSEALVFGLPNHAILDSDMGFLKLFLSSAYVSLDPIQHDTALASNVDNLLPQEDSLSLSEAVWDTINVSLRFSK